MTDIMTAEELRTHKVLDHGRDYSLSSDGYEDMELATKSKWHVISGWGRDGWDLGSWPYVAIYTRDGNLDHPQGRFEMQQIVEGDHTVYRFTSEEQRQSAINYLFLWYAADEDWAPLRGEQREALNKGEQGEIDPKFLGPFSWARLEREKAS